MSEGKKKQLRANRKILKRLNEALRAAKLESCGVDENAQEAMRLYLDTWVVHPLEMAIRSMRGEPEE